MQLYEIRRAVYEDLDNLRSKIQHLLNAPKDKPKNQNKPLSKTAYLPNPGKQVAVDLSTIAQIESNDDPDAEDKGRGLYQFSEPLWKAATQEAFGQPKHFKQAYNVVISQQAANAYWNKIIPKALSHAMLSGGTSIPDNVLDRIACHTWGVENFQILLNKLFEHGVNPWEKDSENDDNPIWVRYSPVETQSYIQKYKELRK